MFVEKKSSKSRVPAHARSLRMFYFAYGSNMSRRQMRQRCPFAKYAGVSILRGWTLKERMFADVDRRKNGLVHGAAWEITLDCERRLDVYEGVRSGLYEKVDVQITLEDGTHVTALCYTETKRAKQDREGDVFSLSYAAICAESAIDIGVPVATLYKSRLLAYGQSMTDGSLERVANRW